MWSCLILRPNLGLMDLIGRLRLRLRKSRSYKQVAFYHKNSDDSDDDEEDIIVDTKKTRVHGLQR